MAPRYLDRKFMVISSDHMDSSGFCTIKLGFPLLLSRCSGCSAWTLGALVRANVAPFPNQNEMDRYLLNRSLAEWLLIAARILSKFSPEILQLG
jgi:uncharacterized membrane protein